MEYFTKNFKEIKDAMVGQTILKVEHTDGDVGFIMYLSNGKTIDVGFSDQEGSIDIIDSK
jgi:hypothetical protein